MAFSLSATFAHERPAARCSMMAASVSCSPWCHARRPSIADECHPAPAERVDERSKVGDAAGAPVELGNQHGADLGPCTASMTRWPA